MPPTGDVDSKALIEAAAAAGVMVVPGHVISVRHLEAAHAQRRRVVQLQKQQQHALALALAAGQAAAAAAPLAPPLAVAPWAPEPCPHFRVSFASASPEALAEGFKRLRAAILACHGPPTPPGEEEAEPLASCSSSSNGSSTVGTPPAAMAAAASAAGWSEAALSVE
jgi:hypothetical protein